MGVPTTESEAEKAAILVALSGGAGQQETDCTAGCISSQTITKGRNLLSYWILGFGNNFTYWVLITAAVDILARTGVSVAGGDFTAPYGNFSDLPSANATHLLKCKATSAGALLVAESLPAASITICALFFLRLPLHLRVFLVVSLCLTSYLTLAFSAYVWLDFTGVLFASVSRGLSDITFLAYAGQYERDVLSTWSSGTGTATFIGPLLYSALTVTGMSPRRALLTMVFVPVLMGISFWVILAHPKDPLESGLQLKQLEVREAQPLENTIGARMLRRLQIMRTAFRLILPLCIFYIEMYFIGSGLLELIYFPGIWLTPSQQYSWYITIQCFGVMVSRSGHRLFHTDRLWAPVIYQGVVLCVLLLEAYLRFLPSVWIMFVILLVQGLMEGTQFKSTMFTIYSQVDELDRKECLAMMPMAFFLPAVMSGLLAIPIHGALCQVH